MTGKTKNGPKGSCLPKAFDPWTATLEEATEANLLSDLHDADPARPIFQLANAQMIESMRGETEGSGFTVLACVRRCANHDLVMPEWLARAFIRRYDAVLNCLANSWDDPLAFGKPYPGTHLSKLRAARTHRMDVYNRVNVAIQLNPKRALDVKLFREVGNEIGLKPTTVQTYYYEAAKFMGRGAKGPLKKRTETRSASQLAAGAHISKLRWGGR